MRERIPMQFPDDYSGHQQRDAVLLGLVVIGASLRLWQYLANTSLWVDEIFLATNILDRSMRQLLTTPLAYGQVAPKGFLFVEKLLSAALGSSDSVLKFFPLLCSLAGLVAFACVVRRVLDGLAASVALALFATARPLVVYASQVKQYSSDVAINVFLLWLAVDLATRKVSLRRSVAAGAIGAVSVWFSQPAVFVVVALGVSLALIAWRERSEPGGPNLPALTPALAMWSISTLFAAVISLTSMTAHTRDFMHQYWAAGFLPIPPWRAIEVRWPWHELKALIGPGGQASLGYPFPSFYLLLIGLGFLLLWHRLGVRATLLLLPIAVTLFAAIVRQYPFADRLILFLVPSFLVAIAVSVDWMYRRVDPWSKHLGVFLCISLVGPAVYPMAAYPPPYQNEDMKPVMSHLEANWRVGDGMYVFHGARPAFGFYSADYGFHDRDYVLGGCHRGENLSYRQELDAFRGRPRLWVVLTHAIPPYKERDDIVSYLDTIGVRRDYFAIQSRGVGQLTLPAEAFLYDLSDPHRLESATAASIPLHGRTFPDAQPNCGDASPIIVPPRRH